MKITIQLCASIVVLLMTASGLCGCHESIRTDRYVEEALELAGDNRGELERVLRHYNGDPLKLEAARFLIANMPGHYSYADLDLTDAYYDTIDVWLDRMVTYNVYQKEYVLNSLHRDMKFNALPVRPDISFISADYLIDNIDRAFRQWEESPWCRYLSFDDFCEYILPYKSHELEELDSWRQDYADMFADSLASLSACTNFYGSSFAAAEMLNRCLIDSFAMQSIGVARPDLPYRHSTMLGISYGTCNDYCLAGMPLFRSAGIPVARDAVPRWGHHNQGHEGLVVLAQNSRTYHFVPFMETAASHMHVNERKPKVYRDTYAINRDLLRLNSSGSHVPAQFRNIFRRDVTDEYGRTFSHSIRTRSGEYVYLAVSSFDKWIPVDYARVDNGKATFDRLGGGCVYMPVAYSKQGVMTPLEPPFLLDLDGSITSLDAVTDSTLSATLYRKSALQEYAWALSRHILGSTIEAADRPDFADARPIATITDSPDRSGVITVGENCRHRYWRIIRRAPEARCEIAELTFFDRTDGTKLSGNPIQSAGTDPIRPASNAFDGNILTPASVQAKGEAWVGIDFGRPVDVGRIQYTPRGDGNTIEPGDEYELLYWGGDRWISLGCRQPTTVSISYDNIPSGALLLLRDLSKGHDVRIFILDHDGSQRWL